MQRYYDMELANGIATRNTIVHVTLVGKHPPHHTKSSVLVAFSLNGYNIQWCWNVRETWGMCGQRIVQGHGQKYMTQPQYIWHMLAGQDRVTSTQNVCATSILCTGWYQLTTHTEWSVQSIVLYCMAYWTTVSWRLSGLAVYCDLQDLLSSYMRRCAGDMKRKLCKCAACKQTDSHWLFKLPSTQLKCYSSCIHLSFAGCQLCLDATIYSATCRIYHQELLSIQCQYLQR